MNDKVSSVIVRRLSLLLAATGMLVAVAGCPAGGVKSGNAGGVESPAVASNPCLDQQALLQQGTTKDCTMEQRICLLEVGLQEAVRAPSFIPQESYQEQWRGRVKIWRGILTEIEKASSADVSTSAETLELDLQEQVDKEGAVGAELRALLVRTDKNKLLCTFKSLASSVARVLPGLPKECTLPDLMCGSLTVSMRSPRMESSYE